MLFGQTLKQEKIISVNTSEKNTKEILFSKRISDSKVSFILKAENISSKDFTKCQWISSFSREELILFINELEALEAGASLENSIFSITYKKKKIKIKIKDTKCIGEHKTFYFQESCNRSLSFILLPHNIAEITIPLKDVLNEINYANK